MGATKSYEFSIKENRLAKYGKALAHPARVAILKLLATKATCQCGDIVEELPLSQNVQPYTLVERFRITPEREHWSGPQERREEEGKSAGWQLGSPLATLVFSCNVVLSNFVRDS